jgi:hypothetical protein
VVVKVEDPELLEQRDKVLQRQAARAKTMEAIARDRAVKLRSYGQRLQRQAAASPAVLTLGQLSGQGEALTLF